MLTRAQNELLAMKRCSTFKTGKIGEPIVASGVADDRRQDPVDSMFDRWAG